ncbi:hypothetical protein AKJ09_08882 [Labilithrix luteola]|uniref:DUF4190 domain-containing protein n=1 Tax=Labilithrix luteola TaxID=1391654 RepID=A0A0K1Q915_9BACT|nr:hypothetical protein AKJ09_08882 [Labilithrix luteola]
MLHAMAPGAVAPELRRKESKAVASLSLGLLSLVCLGAFAGVPAIILGSLARRDIDRSQGMLGGERMAIGGVVTGLFGTGLSLVIGVAALASALSLVQPGDPRSESPMLRPVATGTRSYGALDVVDIDERQSLKTSLAGITQAASSKGRTVVLQTYVRSSRECADVASALPDSRMQNALANVTLVRVDVDKFESELRAMRVDTETVPWFYKLDSASRPTDAISADEWDENTVTNMAPVLDDFVHGNLSSRRSPSPLGIEL